MAGISSEQGHPAESGHADISAAPYLYKRKGTRHDDDATRTRLADRFIRCVRQFNCPALSLKQAALEQHLPSSGLCDATPEQCVVNQDGERHAPCSLVLLWHMPTQMVCRWCTAVKEICHCGKREIETSSAYHYLDDKPVCTSFCYRAIQQDTKLPDFDGYQFGGTHESVAKS